MSDLKPNSLAVRTPHLRGEWSSKNLVKFEDVSYGSGIKRWWECSKCKQSWLASPANRARLKRPTGCPECPTKSLLDVASWLEKEWHPDNTKKFCDVSYGSPDKYKWICSRGHIWTAAPFQRTAERPSGCPDCPRPISFAKSLKAKAPQLECEWHEDNPQKFHEVAAGSHQKYKWICSKCKSTWWAQASNRTYSGLNRCPECNKPAPPSQALKAIAPELESEWHLGNLRQFHEVAAGTHEKYDWMCKEGHVWPAAPYARTGKYKTGCPDCAHRRVSKLNSLVTMAPHLEHEWSPSNSVKFCDVSFSSNEKYEWVCKHNQSHIWMAAPNNRTAKRPGGCPECAVVQSRSELAIFEAVKEKYPDALSGKRGLLKNKRFELDVYIPSLKKAIEFDGTYWHALLRSQERDRRKNEQCIEAGIQLLRIPEAEYEADRASTVKKILDWLVV